MLERDIEKTVVRIALGRGFVSRKVSWIGRRGAPDRVFFGRGRCVWIEFKAPGKRPTGQQKTEIEFLRGLYDDVYVCDSVESALVALGLSVAA